MHVLYVSLPYGLTVVINFVVSVLSLLLSQKFNTSNTACQENKTTMVGLIEKHTLESSDSVVRAPICMQLVIREVILVYIEQCCHLDILQYIKYNIPVYNIKSYFSNTPFTVGFKTYQNKLNNMVQCTRRYTHTHRVIFY